MSQKKLCMMMVAILCLCMAGCVKSSIIPEPVSVPVTKTEQKIDEQPVAVSVNKTDQVKKPFTNSIGMEFVYILPGTFMMGSPPDEQRNKSDSLVMTSEGSNTTFVIGEKLIENQHKVTLTKGFYMQTSEVTQGQWKAIIGNNPSRFIDCGDNCPVEKISWDDAQAFIRKLNEKEGTNKYRLPTEAEWEYAERAGTTTAYNWGNSADCSKANYGNGLVSSDCKDKNPGKTMKVISFAPNEWGLYDMHGNVAEWCQDWYGAYPSGAVTDPAGASSGSVRVLRGCSWLCRAENCLSWKRDGFSSSLRESFTGLRLVRSE